MAVSEQQISFASLAARDYGAKHPRTCSSQPMGRGPLANGSLGMVKSIRAIKGRLCVLVRSQQSIDVDFIGGRSAIRDGGVLYLIIRALFRDWGAMRRREFISVIAGAMAWPLGARAQQAATPVIGFLSARSPKDTSHLVTSFLNGLAENGFAEGQSVLIEYRWALG